jgi:hypothetical protein
MKVLEVSVASERKKDPSSLDHAGQAEVMTVTKKQNQGFFLVHKRKVRNKKKDESPQSKRLQQGLQH